MKILVTAGPSFEPIDEVRRITNHSTGTLGSGLCDFLCEAGYEVTCLLGSGATQRPQSFLPIQSFTTTESLKELLENASSENHAAVFHIAALSDYRVDRIEASSGEALTGTKLESRSGDIMLHLKPAVKLLPLLRSLFPQALLVGWKYELSGDRQDVITKGKRQLSEAQTDHVVLNGKAWGTGFGVLDKQHSLTSLPEPVSLYQHLTSLLR